MSANLDSTLIPSVSTLNRAPTRALALLTGIGKLAHVRKALQTAGFGPDEAAEGYALIKRGTQPINTVRAVPRRTAQAALAGLADQGMAWVRGVHAVLARRTPVLAAEVFRGIDDSLAPVVVVGTLLDRLAALAGDARPEVATARAVLDQRTLGAAKQAELTILVEEATAQRFEDVEAGPNERAQRDEALAALHFWWADWSEVARRAAHNRSDLIVLGLVKRRTSRAVEVDNTGMEPANDDLVTRHAV
jgi:hypothetical protein